MTVKTLLLRAIKRTDGWKIYDTTQGHILDLPVCKTRKEAYIVCSQAYPANSVWCGRRVHGGYRIDI